MRIPSGSTDRKIYFVAVDSTDLKTRETGLSSFTVVRSRDGAADVTYTTPTISEIDSSTMPGVYALTLDEDTTIGSSHDTEEYCLHITQASMAPVTRVIELYRVKFTEGESATMANSAVDSDVERVKGSVINALVSGRVDSSVGAMANDVVTAAAIANAAIDAATFAAGAIDAAAIADNAIDAGAIAANAITAAKIADGAIDAATFAAGAIDAAAIATDAIGAAELAAGAANKIRDTILSDATAFAGASIGLIKAKTDNLPTDPADESLLEAAIAGVQADTDNIQTRLPAALVGGRMASNAEVVGDKTGYALTVAEHAAVADKLLGRTRAGGADGGRTVAECLAFGRNRWEIAGGVLTVYADDDTTPLYTAAITTAAGDPVTSVDPA